MMSASSPLSKEISHALVVVARSARTCGSPVSKVCSE